MTRDNMKKSLENAKNEYNSPQEEGQIIGLTGVYWLIGIWFLIIFLMIGILFAQS